MQVSVLSTTFVPALFEFWYDLEVLRAQLFRLPSPVLDSRAWVAQQNAWLNTDGAMGVFCHEAAPLGALGVLVEGNTAEVRLFVVDLHTPERRAIGNLLWTDLREELLSRSVTCLRASAKHNLPVEAAFWQARKAMHTELFWEVFL
jgi:hypothetical protein